MGKSTNIQKVIRWGSAGAVGRFKSRIDNTLLKQYLKSLLQYLKLFINIHWRSMLSQKCTLEISILT